LGAIFLTIGVAVLLDQERQRFGYIFQDKRDQYDRRAGSDEHPLPAISVDQSLAENGGQNAADCVAAGGEGDEASADLDRHILDP